MSGHEAIVHVWVIVVVGAVRVSHVTRDVLARERRVLQRTRAVRVHPIQDVLVVQHAVALQVACESVVFD